MKYGDFSDMVRKRADGPPAISASSSEQPGKTPDGMGPQDMKGDRPTGMGAGASCLKGDLGNIPSELHAVDDMKRDFIRDRGRAYDAPLHEMRSRGHRISRQADAGAVPRRAHAGRLPDGRGAAQDEAKRSESARLSRGHPADTEPNRVPGPPASAGRGARAEGGKMTGTAAPSRASHCDPTAICSLLAAPYRTSGGTISPSTEDVSESPSKAGKHRRPADGPEGEDGR